MNEKPREDLFLNNLAILAQELQRNDFDYDEWKIIEGLELGNIDLAEEKNIYQLQLIKALLERTQHGSMLKSVLTQMGELPSIAKIECRKMMVDDLGKNIGTKREVDLVTIIFKNGEKAEFTTSIDIASCYEDEETASEREAANLHLLRNRDVQGVQKLYGFRKIEVEDPYSEDPKNKVVICKEYLEGEMLEGYIMDIDHTVEQIGEEAFRRIAYLTGYTMQEAVTKSGFVVKDSNPLNFIVGEKNGEIFVRYCDADTISNDQRETAIEFRLLRPRFGKYAADFDAGMEAAKRES